MASTPWPARSQRRRRLALGLVALGVGLAALTAAWRLTGRGGNIPQAAARPEAATAPRAPEWPPTPSAMADLPREAPARSTQAPPPSEAGFPVVTRSQPSAVREPERELSAPAPSPPDLVLNAISERDGHAVALINDRLVREGDEFDGVKILRIGEAEVEVERAGRRSVIRF